MIIRHSGKMKNSKKTIFFLFFIVSNLLFAQKNEALSVVFSDNILLTEVNPLHPLGIFTIDYPFYIGTFNKKDTKISAAYSMGNNWHPKATIYYPQNLIDQQREDVNNLFYFNRPAYFEEHGIETKIKSYSADGVLQNLSVTYLWQLAQSGTFIFKLNAHLLSGGSSPVHYLAGDRFISWSHDLVGLHNNYGRCDYMFDQAHIEFVDENNKKIRIDRGTAFLGTFDVHYYRSLWKRENSRSCCAFQVGAHVALPLNNYYSKVAGGVSGAFLYRKQMTPTFSADFGLDFQLSHHSLIHFGDNAEFIDLEVRKSAKQYLAFNFRSNRNGQVYYISVINNYQDPYLNGYMFSLGQDKYADLGASFLQPGDVWEGYTLQKSIVQSKLTVAALCFFSIKTYLILGFKTDNADFSFTIGEDKISVNNAPDIQYGFRYTQTLCRKK